MERGACFTSTQRLRPRAAVGPQYAFSSAPDHEGGCLVADGADRTWRLQYSADCNANPRNSRLQGYAEISYPAATGSSPAAACAHHGQPQYNRGPPADDTSATQDP